MPTHQKTKTGFASVNGAHLYYEIQGAARTALRLGADSVTLVGRTIKVNQAEARKERGAGGPRRSF